MRKTLTARIMQITKKIIRYLFFSPCILAAFLAFSGISANTDIHVPVNALNFDAAHFFDLAGIGFRTDQANFNKGWLGIFMENAEGQGILVKELTRGSPAAIAGLQTGDIITKINGESTLGKDNLNLIRFKKTIETLGAEGIPELTVDRNGSETVCKPKLFRKLLKNINDPSAPFSPGIFSKELSQQAPHTTHTETDFLDFAVRNKKYKDSFAATLQRIGEEAYAREGFQSDAETNAFRLSAINYMMLHPFDTPKIGQFIQSSFSEGTAVSQIEFAAKLLDIHCSDEEKNDAQTESLQQLLQSLINSLPRCATLVKAAFHNVTEEELDFLYQNAGKIWIPEEKIAPHALAEFLAVSQKVCLGKLFEATSELLRKLTPLLSYTYDSTKNRKPETASPETGQNHVSPFLLPQSIQTGNAKAAFRPEMKKRDAFRGDILFVQDTTLGKIVVGGTGTSYYYADAAIIIDLGGNDYYFNNAGASGKDIPVSVCIDLSGNDAYNAANPFAQGAGRFGTGILIDLQGDDTYVSQDFSQGTGLFGIGALIDKEGHDFYSGHVLNQGVGFFGMGLLDDSSGNDVYFSRQYAQGVGFTKGVGALIDTEGNDSYSAGGKYSDFRDPGKSFQAMSQGMGMGIRPEENIVGASGGIGILIDQKGADRYHGDYFSQGSGYYFSLGCLFDKEGSDRYYAGRYAQGAGIHSAIGLLNDSSGDDFYECTLGVGQGCGHDAAVGFLIDDSGNDTYRSETTAQGSALEKGIGVLADLLGNNDSYSANSNSMGFSSPSKTEDINSIGMLIDNQGEHDIFRDPIPENSLLYRSNGGLVLNK